ncbi:hypothetical protein Goshw_010414 [Gossypium schwendimanii]|uniref:BURP domain-containing protein n=1 Tax=Gossypium schwendimanii TaxID=34291 RepID=A0A7J9N5P2_GOSSC|nr:hypothetical protein [Gossypium schwendimanii]
MVLRYTYPVLLCILILMHGRWGYAVKDEIFRENETKISHHIKSAEVGLFTMDELLNFHVGQKLPIFFPIRNLSLYPPFFLPPKYQNIIPFIKPAAMFNLFKVPPSSPKGKAFLGTLYSCDSINGETTKICATSLDSMLGFVKKAFGPDVDFKFITTTHPTLTTPVFQNYTVLEPPVEIVSVKKVPCHPFPYFYAIYFCHTDLNYETRAFKLRLVGDGSGDEVEAVIVCHLDSKNLSSDHLVFRMLGVEKGSSYCHVFRQGDILWIQQQTSGGGVAAV